jgi:hypothetical protein
MGTHLQQMQAGREQQTWYMYKYAGDFKSIPQFFFSQYRMAKNNRRNNKTRKNIRKNKRTRKNNRRG